MLSSELVVLHALPGFWHPDDLARELHFARVVERLWSDPSKSRDTKERMVRRMHRRFVYGMPAETYARSEWQRFDQFAELERLHRGERRDTVFRDVEGDAVQAADGGYRFKSLNVLAHERMARQPFRTWDAFDVEAFVDYGLMHYDLNSFEKTRKRFRGQSALRRQRARADRR